MKLINKERITYCLLITTICFFIIHGFVMTNNFVCHDSLNEFDATIFGNEWKIQLGRVFTPFYRVLFRTSYTPVWMIGIISILFLSLTLFLIIELFDIRSKLIIFLIGGILTSNLTIIALSATYINDLDSNMFALFLSTLAVFFWNKYTHGYFIGSIFLMLAIGIYQSFISVTIVLVIIVLLLDLLKGKDASFVFKNGLKSGIMLILGCLLYYLALKIIPQICGVKLVENNYNSVTNSFSLNFIDILRYGISSVKECIWCIVYSLKSYPKFISITIHGIFVTIYIYIIFKYLYWKNIDIKSKIIFILLLFALAIGMNISHILTKGMSHQLMYYAFWFIYLLLLILVTNEEILIESTKLMQTVSIILIIVVLWNNFLTANVIYMKKDIERHSTMQLFNRIIGDLEDSSYYKYKESKVMFIGNPSEVLSTTINYNQISSVLGARMNNSVGFGSYSYYKAYFDYILNYPINLVDEESCQKYKNNGIVQKMPSYPENGYIQEIDGTIIIKLSMGE